MRLPSLILITVCACSRAPETDLTHLNVVDPAVLAPRLLHDEAEIKAYVDAFPANEYTIKKVSGQGWFYLDAAKDTIKNFLRMGIAWERHVDILVGKHSRPRTTLIDAGAHIGTHTWGMSRAAGPQGRVYAFEPQKKIYRELVKNLELNKFTNVVPLRFALGAKPEIIEMGASVEGNEGGTGISGGGDKAELRTIDSFGFTNVSFIKIDVEGFEDQVIEGAKETIARNRPAMLVEILGGNDYATAPPDIKARIDASKQKIELLGYTITRVSPHDYLAIPNEKVTKK